MTGCSAPNCSAHSNKGDTFHRFPTDLERRKRWLINCRRANWNPKPTDRLCSKHFENSQYEQHRQDKKRQLKPFAVPTLFDVPNSPKKVSESRRQSLYQDRSNTPDDSQAYIPDVQIHTHSETDTDHNDEELHNQGTMVEGLTEDPLDITKQPAIIKEAQKDVSKLDILVCGQCHEVFHFVEQFIEHKSPNKCPKTSDLSKTYEAESRSQVWAYALWKQKQLRIKNEGESAYPSAWSIYQRWTKLSQADREIWIAAGDFIQWQNKINIASLKEVKTVSPVKDPLALDDTGKEQETFAKTDVPKNVVRLEEKKPEIKKEEAVKSVTKVINDKSAIRTAPSANEQQFVVERILAKRFTPKRKTWEYKIKWENFPEEESTWEPLAHLESCKALVDEFEENLRKLKIEKAKQSAAASPPRSRGRPRLSTSPSPSLVSNSSTEKASGSRPQRTSKQKALNQVKAWCGNISDGEEAGGVKRPYEEDSSDDSVEKRIKLEAESEDTEDEYERKTAPKRTPKSVTINNGLGVGSKLPDNILIPDAKGVVRINQKQLPALSSGVYIMSKTAGIIKLDSATSKIATSGGQAIVKVAPKIGQTHIKIVKKDGGTTSKVIPISSKSSPMVKQQALRQTRTTPKHLTSVAKVKKVMVTDKSKSATPAAVDKNKSVVSAEEAKEKAESSDSDYGLEELEFPAEIKIPEPESPQGEFVLDPVTGKIAGQEYPEPEPEPETLPEEPEAETKPEIDSSGVDNSLDNLVKLAAADITEDDLQPLPAAPSAIEESIADESAMDTTPASTAETVSSTTKQDVVCKSENDDNDSDGVILVSETKPSTAVETKPLATITTKESTTRTTILQQTLQTTSTPRPKIQQRILNQSIASRPSPQFTTVMKSVPTQRKVIAPPKPKFQISSPSPRMPQYHKGSMPRRIGSTTIYKSTPIIKKEPVKQPVKRVVYQTSPSYKSSGITYKTTQSSFKHSPSFKTQTVYKTTQKKESPVILNSSVSPMKPKPVISMPSLSAEEEPVVESVQATTAATTSSAEETATLAETDLSSFTLENNEPPIFLTGDDGTVYQVAGQDEQGQTILITQGADGQQQCLLVTSEGAAEEVPQQAEASPTSVTAAASMTQAEAEEPLTIKTDDVPQDQVVAQVVRTEPPSPGGTHKVVVMLPDGNLMVTQVTPEEYASLELDK